jgi:hypothetical protein
MREKGLAAVRLGKAFLYDEKDVVTFIEKQKTCQDQTEGRVSTGSLVERPSTFSGTTTGRSAFGQLARQTAAKLKQPSRGSSGQVISMPGRGNQGK